MEDSLFCDEVFLGSPPSSPVVFNDAGEERERESLLSSCLERQSEFFPVEGYLEKLRKTPALSRLRLRAARWLLVVRFIGGSGRCFLREFSDFLFLSR